MNRPASVEKETAWRKFWVDDRHGKLYEDVENIGPGLNRNQEGIKHPIKAVSFPKISSLISPTVSGFA